MTDKAETSYDELYASFRELKCRSKHTKTTIKIKMLLDMFEDSDEADDKHKCLHDIRYFLERLERDM
jgi:hypothetical protein